MTFIAVMGAINDEQIPEFENKYVNFLIDYCPQKALSGPLGLVSSFVRSFDIYFKFWLFCIGWTLGHPECACRTYLWRSVEILTLIRTNRTEVWVECWFSAFYLVLSAFERSLWFWKFQEHEKIAIGKYSIYLMKL